MLCIVINSAAVQCTFILLCGWGSVDRGRVGDGEGGGEGGVTTARSYEVVVQMFYSIFADISRHLTIASRWKREREGEREGERE